MKVAVIGSRDLNISNLEDYIPKETTEIISGGAKGIDSCAKKYALENNIMLTEILPNYRRYGRKYAPLQRNELIIKSSDLVIAFWDGKSMGTKYVINKCKELKIKVKVFIIV